MSEKRKVFGQAGACLHCMVWDLINTHSPDWPDGSGKQYHAEYIVGNLVDVMAELISGFPRNERRQFVKLVDKRLADQIASNIANGNVPSLKSARTH
jgi:hypothetical protein